MIASWRALFIKTGNFFCSHNTPPETIMRHAISFFSMVLVLSTMKQCQCDSATFYDKIQLFVNEYLGVQKMQVSKSYSKQVFSLKNWYFILISHYVSGRMIMWICVIFNVSRPLLTTAHFTHSSWQQLNLCSRYVYGLYWRIHLPEPFTPIHSCKWLLKPGDNLYNCSFHTLLGKPHLNARAEDYLYISNSWAISVLRRYFSFSP